MNADGTGINQLTQFAGLSYQTQAAQQASITPDGSRILFITTIPTPPSLLSTTVWVMRSDGQGQRSLPIDNRVEVVAFSVDGALVAWSLNGRSMCKT